MSTLLLVIAIPLLCCWLDDHLPGADPDIRHIDRETERRRQQARALHPSGGGRR